MCHRDRPPPHPPQIPIVPLWKGAAASPLLPFPFSSSSHAAGTPLPLPPCLLSEFHHWSALPQRNWSRVATDSAPPVSSPRTPPFLNSSGPTPTPSPPLIAGTNQSRRRLSEHRHRWESPSRRSGFATHRRTARSVSTRCPKHARRHPLASPFLTTSTTSRFCHRCTSDGRATPSMWCVLTALRMPHEAPSAWMPLAILGTGPARACEATGQKRPSTVPTFLNILSNLRITEIPLNF
jgi:hypothetical protein